jgi:hypothetical protein
MLYSASDLAVARKKTKLESSTCTIEILFDNENINLIKDAQLCGKATCPIGQAS